MGRAYPLFVKHKKFIHNGKQPLQIDFIAIISKKQEPLTPRCENFGLKYQTQREEERTTSTKNDT